VKVENLVFSGEKNKYILKKKVPKNTNTVKKQKKKAIGSKKKDIKKNIAKISTHDAEKISHFLENIVKSLPKKYIFFQNKSKSPTYCTSFGPKYSNF
jgi:ssDNA-specific exonuclease RecJ